jgi:hypothetical protein
MPPIIVAIANISDTAFNLDIIPIFGSNGIKSPKRVNLILV